jgi:hypothetical protein
LPYSRSSSPSSAPPALAQDASRHAWGDPATDRGPSVLSVARCAFPCFAVVRFDNTLVANGSGALALGGARRNLLTHEATLALDGVPTVVVEQGDRRLPDVLRVTPPQGYGAEPGEIVVDDDCSVRVVLVPVG